MTYHWLSLFKIVYIGLEYPNILKFDEHRGIKVIELVLSLMSEYFILLCTKCQGILGKEALIYKVFFVTKDVRI